jgi:hypothetical protein
MTTSVFQVHLSQFEEHQLKQSTLSLIIIPIIPSAEIISAHLPDGFDEMNFRGRNLLVRVSVQQE